MTRFVRPLCALLLLTAGVTPAAAQKWKVQYFYDNPKSRLIISDLKFVSAARGIAVGLLVKKTKADPVSLVTSDGGANWQMVPLEDEPQSLFVLNETAAWMVGEKGLWFTTEAGRAWAKLAKPPSGISRVWFVDEQHGWAVGRGCLVVETIDGGRTWKKVDLKLAPKDAKSSTCREVLFPTPQVGVITGHRAGTQIPYIARPDFVDPEGAMLAPVSPNRLMLWISTDGGGHWTQSSAITFGTMSRIRLNQGNTGIGLIRYGNTMRFPSEIFAITATPWVARTIFRNDKFALSDVWLTPGGKAFASGTAVRGQIRNVTPSPVRVLTSDNLNDWKSIPVDYRAEAVNTILAGFGDNVWVATDTGMILKLVN